MRQIFEAIVGNAVLGTITLLLWSWRQAMRQLFGEVGEILDRVTEHSTKSVGGIKDGRTVRALYRQRSEEDYETRVDCDLPGRPFALELRPQTMKEQERIFEGKTIDVQVCDPAFDACWVIEGAPADVVRRVLDDSVRRRFGLLFADSLTQPNSNTLRLRIDGKQPPQWMSEAILLLVTIANSIDRAYEEADREASRRVEITGSPYRGEVRATGDARAQREREFEALRKVRLRRWLLSGKVIAPAVIALVSLVMVLRNC